MMSYGFGGGIGMMIFWIAIVIFLTYFAIEIIKKNTSQKGNSNSLEILKNRLALGEISKEEFSQLKSELTATRR